MSVYLVYLKPCYAHALLCLFNFSAFPSTFTSFRAALFIGVVFTT